MGTGYTRNDTVNNIADGNVINASDLDGEFDALQSAFNASTGHTHDGTTAEGAPIEVTGPAQEYVSTNSEFRPKTNNTYDLGSASIQWKDLYVDGTANLDTVDIDAGNIDGTTIGGSTPAAGTFTTLSATGNVTLGNAATDTVTITADVASNLIPSADNTYDLGASGSEWKDLYIDGTANIDSLVADTADINAGTIDGATIGGSSAAAGTFTNVTATGTVNLSGATVSNGGSVTTVDINGGTIDGVTIGGSSAGAGTFTTLTATGNVTLGNAATDTVTITADVASSLIPSADDTYDLGAVGSEWRNLYIDGTANIDSLAADSVSATGTVTFGTLSDGVISITAFVDEDNMASNSDTLVPTQQSVKAYVDSTAGVAGLTATGTELNVLDGDTTPVSVTLAGTDGFPVNDAGTTKLALISDISTYIQGQTVSFTNATLTTPTVSGLYLSDSGFVVEGSSADANETTVTFTNPTADRTITFPNATGTVLLSGVATVSDISDLTATAAELNVLDGITANVNELNILDGVTASTAEINILDGVTASTAEINILDGVTATTAELNILDGVTATTAELNYNDVTTLGTSQASKTVTADANGNIKLTEEVQAVCYLETVVALSGTSPTVDCDEGNTFTLTTSGNTTFTFSYAGVQLTTDDAYAFTLRITAGGTHTLTWPASVDWAGGSAPDAPASGETNVYVFFTTDGGTNWYGFLAGAALS